MKLYTWNYRDGLEWEFHVDEEIPNKNNIYAVAGVVFRWDNYLITQNRRWWELTAWHIEPNETVEDSIIRESMEEVWADVKSLEYLWFMSYELQKNKVLFDRQIPIWETVYLPVYICEADSKAYKPTGEEIFDYQEKPILSVDNESDLTPWDKKTLQFAIKKRSC